MNKYIVTVVVLTFAQSMIGQQELMNGQEENIEPTSITDPSRYLEDQMSKVDEQLKTVSSADDKQKLLKQKAHLQKMKKNVEKGANIVRPNTKQIGKPTNAAVVKSGNKIVGGSQANATKGKKSLKKAANHASNSRLTSLKKNNQMRLAQMKKVSQGAGQLKSEGNDRLNKVKAKIEGLKKDGQLKEADYSQKITKIAELEKKIEMLKAKLDKSQTIK